MLIDTDVLIWVTRGNEKICAAFDALTTRYISLQTYLELLQCAPSKKHQQITINFLKEFEITTLPLTEKIGHRAAIYIEEHAMGSGLSAGDAIIAATAIEHKLTLLSANRKHFKTIKALNLKALSPQ